jgi:hypothetical protein
LSAAAVSRQCSADTSAHVEDEIGARRAADGLDRAGFRRNVPSELCRIHMAHSSRYPLLNFRRRSRHSLYDAGSKKSRKRLYIGAACAVVVSAARPVRDAQGRLPEIDASTARTVERGTMVKSVVATGKVEPITKIEIKSKANGIIKALNADIDLAVKEGDILVELDKEQLAAALRGAEANLLAARASLEAAEAQRKKNRVEAEGPDASSRAAPTNARSRSSRSS